MPEPVSSAPSRTDKALKGHQGHEYPTDFPAEDIKIFLGYLYGNPPPLADVLNSGWWLCGYALNQVAPHTPLVGSPAKASAHVSEMCKADLIKQLETLSTTQGKLKEAGVAGTVNWLGLAITIGNILIKLLSGL